MLSKSRGVFRWLGPQCAWLVASLLLGTPAAFSQQKVETPQETNDRLRQLAAAMQVKQGDYVIGGGDLVHIEVFEVPELSREVRVSASGFISLPLLPMKVRAAGLTAAQLEEKLAELLQVNGLVSHPQVSVFVKEQRSEPITVIGAVPRPLVYQSVRPTTLLEVLTEAGGITGDAGSIIIVNRRIHTEAAPNDTDGAGDETTSVPAQQHTITIDVEDLLQSPDSQYNIPLIGGDIVRVPRAGVVYVVGAVGRPGAYVLRSDREQMTTIELLALAGGYQPTAKAHKAVILRRNPTTGEKREVQVDLAKVMARRAEDLRMLPNDILYVPDSGQKKALRRTGEAAIALASGVAFFRVTR